MCHPPDKHSAVDVVRSRSASSTSTRKDRIFFCLAQLPCPLLAQEKALGHCCQALRHGQQCKQPSAWLDDLLASALAVVDAAFIWPDVPAVAARPVLASLWPPLEAVLNR